MNPAFNFSKPQKIIVTPDQARGWSADDYLIQIKADGIFQTRELPLMNGQTFTVAGEWVTKKSGGFLAPGEAQKLALFPAGFFAAFDLLAYQGMDLRQSTTFERWENLKGCSPCFPAHMFLVDHLVSGCASIPPGAEGIVAKAWGEPYGQMECVKRLTTYRCVVTKTGSSQSVEIADADTGINLGKIKLGGMKVDRVRVGSVLKVESLGLHSGGKLRESRLCADTEDSWLISY